VKSDVKTADSEISRLQAFVLDPVGPLTQLLEDPKHMENDIAGQLVTAAQRIMGNASTQISNLRRKKVLTAVNPDIQHLSEEEPLFKTAPPDLSVRQNPRC
jgi:hypothetical protein